MSRSNFILLIISLMIAGVFLVYFLQTLKTQDMIAKEQQESMNYPSNSSRSFTLRIGGKPVYFEFIGIEILKDVDSMLFMPHEIPINTTIDQPLIASMKFSFRVNCSWKPSLVHFSDIIGEIEIERYDEKEDVWKPLISFDLPYSVKESPSLIPLILQNGDRFDVYWSTEFPPLKTPLWFNEIDRNVRLHAILRIISDGSEKYRTGDILYHAGNMTVVYERGLKPAGRDYYVNYLHVYIEPFKLPYAKFKVENVKFLSCSEFSSKIELTFRNVGSLPIIGKAYKLSSEGYAEFNYDFDFIPDNTIIFTINREAFTGEGNIYYVRDPHVVIDLPKPWEKKGWAVIIFPNETVKAIVYAEIEDNQVIIKGQEGEIVLHAKPVPQRILNIDADPYGYNLELRKIIVEIKNEGSSPFFAEKAKINVSVDGKEVPIDRVWGFVPPGEVGEIELWLKTSEKSCINYKELAKGFAVKVSVDDNEVVYNVPPLAPKLKVIDIIYGETLEKEKCCKGLIINIEDNWIFPVGLKWLEVYVNGKPYSYFIEDGESGNLIVKFTEDIELGSIIEIKLGATVLKVKV